MRGKAERWLGWMVGLEPALEEIAPGVKALPAGRRWMVIAVSLLVFAALAGFALRRLWGPLRRRFFEKRPPEWRQFV